MGSKAFLVKETLLITRVFLILWLLTVIPIVEAWKCRLPIGTSFRQISCAYPSVGRRDSKEDKLVKLATQNFRPDMTMGSHFCERWVDKMTNRRKTAASVASLGVGVFCGVMAIVVGSSAAFAQYQYVPKSVSRGLSGQPSYVARRTADGATSEGTNRGAAEAVPTPAPQAEGKQVAAEETGVYSDIAANGKSPLSATAEAGEANDLWEGCDLGSACEDGGGYCNPPLWYTDQGARIMMRSRSRKWALANILTATTLSSTGATVYVPQQAFSTNDITYGAAPGYQATIGRYLGRDSMDRDDFLEFSYWGMNTWTAMSEATTDKVISAPGTSFSASFGAMFSPFMNRHLTYGGYFSDGDVTSSAKGIAGFDRVSSMRVDVSTEIHDFELNMRLKPRGRPDQLVLHPDGRWRREAQPGWESSYLLGVRYFTLGDGFYWRSRGDVAYNSETYHTSGMYNVRTENDLLGLQVGGDWMYRQKKWEWGFRGKFGPYVNFARDIQEVYNDADGSPYTEPFTNGRFTARKQCVSMIAEIGMAATYKFDPHFAVKAGYDLMWISGLALSPEQLEFDTPYSHIRTSGSMMTQGLSMSAEWTW